MLRSENIICIVKIDYSNQAENIFNKRVLYSDVKLVRLAVNGVVNYVHV